MDGGRDQTERPPPQSLPPPPPPPPLPLSFLMMNPSVSSLFTSSSSSQPLGGVADFNELVGQLLYGGPSCQNGEPGVMDGSSPGNEKSVGEGSGEEVGDNKERGKNPSKTRKPTTPRIAFQTRSADDVLDDGYRWRKYGQKAVKNSAYPRSYYRCTHHTCNVKKQVQRLSKDTSVVVTTYEGIHNHPCEKLMETLAPLLKQMHFLSSF